MNAVIPSSIQTILSVLELHQITSRSSYAKAFADYTADRELHPALKIFQTYGLIIHRFAVFDKRNLLDIENLARI